jgi:hypothetical protein
MARTTPVSSTPDHLLGIRAKHSQVQEQRIVRLRISNQPLHPPDDILLDRDGARVPLIVGEDDRIFRLVIEPLYGSAFT